MKRIIGWLIVIVIILLVIFVQHKYFPTVITITTTDTIWSDTGSISYVPNPYPVYIDTSKTDTIVLPADSVAITKAYIKLHQDFYSVYFYKDTVVNDSNMFIEIGTKISQNKPLNYDVKYFDKTPTIINNTTNIYSKNEIFIGLNNAAPSILYKSKKGWIGGVGYDLLNKDERIRVQAYIGLDIFKK